MAMEALEAGFSWRDLRNIKYTHLMQALYEWDDMHGAEVDETVEATGADIKALMRL